VVQPLRVRRTKRREEPFTYLPCCPAQHAPHQNATPTSTPYKSPNMEPIEAAPAAIESLEPGEKPSYMQVAQDYCVVRIYAHAETPTRFSLTQHQGSKLTSAPPSARVGASTIYQPAHRARLTTYLSYDTTLLRHISRKESLEKAGLIDISSDTMSISSHAGQRGSIALATRLTLSQSIASTSSSCVVSSANTISSLAIRTIWMRRALC
jgi:hypothetical protein